jgi:UDP-N-acetylglucosamine:LPS N-acetylglucosamine transferase
MLSQQNILILTSSTGGGHISLAEALRDLIERDLAPEPGENAAPPTPAISIAAPQPCVLPLSYRLVSRYALRLWAAEFHFFDTPRRALLAHRIITPLVRRRLRALLDTLRPDLILTTHPLLSYEVKRVLEQRASNVPLVLLFSDAQAVHTTWLSERRATAAFAPTRETHRQALAAGFAPERLHLVGWPVRTQFFQALSSRQARIEQLARLNLDPNRLTVFLQGGGEGTARVHRALDTILSSGLTNQLQIILAIGTNAGLRERYSHIQNVAVLPYTRDIAPFMAAADLIMGKAGPNMLMEAVTLGKPFLATTCIPGQEQANLTFIQRHNLGWVALQPAEQIALLAELAGAAPDLLKQKQPAIDAYRRWNAEATQRIAPLIASYLRAESASSHASSPTRTRSSATRPRLRPGAASRLS